MTFCLGITVKDGLIGLADTRITMASEYISAKKVKLFQCNERPLFVMTSGLRSVKDKVMTYFQESLDTNPDPATVDRLYKVANLYAAQLRRVYSEDKPSLDAGGLVFDMCTLMGGQLENDDEHCLYLIYPEGNWVQITEGTHYQIIGAPNFGKPVLDRTLKYEDTLRFALKVGCLAFDSTRISAADVGFPLDVVLYRKNSFTLIEHRYETDDLAEMTNWWQDRLRATMRDLPADPLDGLIDKLADLDAIPPLRTIQGV